jgi:DNA replication factor GINS
MDLSYDEIRRIYRLEKNKSDLTELDEDFYNSLNEFIKAEKKKYLESLASPADAKPEDFNNMKRLVEEIYNLREKKILNRALLASRTSEADSGSMALQEKKLFQGLVELLSRQRLLLSELFENNAEKGTAEEKKELDLNILSIRILKDIPSFVASDMKEYGPFNEGQAVSLPYTVAKLFIERKLAEQSKGD